MFTTTTKTPSTGLIFGRVTCMERAQNQAYGTVKYTISNGSTFYGKNHGLKVNEWYFIEVSITSLQNYEYISHRPLAQHHAESLLQAQSDLKFAATEAVNLWRQMEREERALTLQAMGIATTSGIALSSLFSVFAEEAVLGSMTGGLSLLFSGAMAGISYLQWEARKDAVAQHARTLDQFNLKRKRLSDQLALHTPLEYRHLVPLDPQVQAIVTRIRLMISNFSFADLLKAQPERDYCYALA